jgi:hypothetical protein
MLFGGIPGARITGDNSYKKWIHRLHLEEVLDRDLMTGDVRTRVEAEVKKIEKELDYADRVYYN